MRGANCRASSSSMTTKDGPLAVTAEKGQFLRTDDPDRSSSG